MKFVLIIFIITISGTACTKKNQLDNNSKDIIESILGSWKLISMTSEQAFDWNGDGTVEIDYYSSLNNCDKEHMFNFSTSANGIHVFSCVETREFNWKLIQNGTVIEYYYPPISETSWAGYSNSTIVSISPTILKLRWKTTSPANTLTSLEATYQKQ